MKKVILSLVLAGFITIGSMSGNSVFAGIANTEVPDVEKKVKKETSKTSKKVAVKQTSKADQDNTDLSQAELQPSATQDDFDTNNPANNDDCTKEGFDKE